MNYTNKRLNLYTVIGKIFTVIFIGLISSQVSAQPKEDIITCNFKNNESEYIGTCAVPCEVNALKANFDEPQWLPTVYKWWRDRTQGRRGLLVVLVPDPLPADAQCVRLPPPPRPPPSLLPSN